MRKCGCALHIDRVTRIVATMAWSAVRIAVSQHCSAAVAWDKQALSGSSRAQSMRDSEEAMLYAVLPLFLPKPTKI